MKFLVCVSNVPDTTTKITFTPDKKAFNTSGVQFIINPYDEIALTRALELKEAAGSGSVTVIHVGPAPNEAMIRKALAIGADDAIRINAEATDAFQVASLIAAAIKDEKYDLIFTGRESIDYNGAQVGGMLAELLGIPSVSVVTKLDLNGNEATGNLPLVVTGQKGMAEPRIPNMRGIMTARTKPLKVVEPAAIDALTVSVAFDNPPPKQAVKLVDPNNMEELVNLLHNEAKVI